MSHHTGVETAHCEEWEDTLYPNNHAGMLCGSFVAFLTGRGQMHPHCVILMHDVKILLHIRGGKGEGGHSSAGHLAFLAQLTAQLKHNSDTSQSSEVWLIGACIHAFRLESSMHCLKSHS